VNFARPAYLMDMRRESMVTVTVAVAEYQKIRRISADLFYRIWY
jgi:hypothetical protein